MRSIICTVHEKSINSIRKHLLHSVYVFVFFITILQRYLSIKTGQIFQEKMGYSMVGIGQFLFYMYEYCISHDPSQSISQLFHLLFAQYFILSASWANILYSFSTLSHTYKNHVVVLKVWVFVGVVGFVGWNIIWERIADVLQVFYLVSNF